MLLFNVTFLRCHPKSNISNIVFEQAYLFSKVIISAIAFGGKPLEILKRALCREFLLIMGPNITTEVRRNFVGKLGLKMDQVDLVLSTT